MKKIVLFFIFCLVYSFTSTASETDVKANPLVRGKVVSFRTKGKHKVSYHVYTPNNFNKNTPPPIVVAFSAGGFGMKLLEKFIPAAEEMGWIGVGCDSLSNSMNDDKLAMEIEDELLDEILSTIPHNAERIYLTGGSGGAMRSYGITARRPEKFAGVLAHGGWLGGENYQNKPYKEGMHIAMLNGNLDMGAGGWTVTDTKTLRKRSCIVKHFTCMGGHMVAPVPVTLIAMKWLEEQWSKSEWEDPNKISLKVLCIGENKKRLDAYQSFLSKHFISVKAISCDSVTLSNTNEADILLLDDALYTLPDNYNKAMLLIGPAALPTGKRFGSKMEQEGSSFNANEVDIDTTHVIYNIHYKVRPLLKNGEKQIWEMNKSKAGTIKAHSDKFELADDSEVLLKSISENGNQGALVFREASRLFWGDTTLPHNNNKEAQLLFINALIWIHDFDGLRQTVYSGLTPRNSISSIIDKIDLNSKEAMRWFPEEILEECEYNKQKLKNYYLENMAYIFNNYGSGQLRVDQEALSIKTANNNKESIQEWINLFDKSDRGPERAKMRRILIRYTNQFLRNTKEWQEWYDQNKEKLVFSDEDGYQFVVKEE